MDMSGIDDRTLKEYRALETELHRELMKICREYINDLGIVSIMGILDIVKQEAVELERATKKIMKSGETETEDKRKSDTDFFNREQIDELNKKILK